MKNKHVKKTRTQEGEGRMTDQDVRETKRRQEKDGGKSKDDQETIIEKVEEQREDKGIWDTRTE